MGLFKGSDSVEGKLLPFFMKQSMELAHELEGLETWGCPHAKNVSWQVISNSAWCPALTFQDKRNIPVIYLPLSKPGAAMLTQWREFRET